MGHYDSCYAADEAKEAAKHVTEQEMVNLIKTLRDEPIIYHDEEVERNRVILRAIDFNEKYKDLIVRERFTYREVKATLTREISDEELAKLYLEVQSY